MNLRYLLLALVASSFMYASTEEKKKDGYFILLTNETTETLSGTLYLMLIDVEHKNQLPLVLKPGETDPIYVGKVSNHLTDGQKAISDIFGKIIGYAIVAGADVAGVELPPQVADAIAKVPSLIIDNTDTCISGFNLYFKGYEYSYQFGNGCTNQAFTIKAENKGTELRIYDVNGNVNTWGSVQRKGHVPAVVMPTVLPNAAAAA